MAALQEAIDDGTIMMSKHLTVRTKCRDKLRCGGYVCLVSIEFHRGGDWRKRAVYRALTRRRI